MLRPSDIAVVKCIDEMDTRQTAWTGRLVLQSRYTMADMMALGQLDIERLGWTTHHVCNSYAEAEAAKAIILDAEVGITPEGVI